MPVFVIMLCSLLFIQCTLAQCIGSRYDGFASFPNIPTEYLALENYGAMDFLSSPLLESIRPNILTETPVASITEVKCGNPFISPTPYAIDPINYEFPYATNIFPDTFENPFAVNLLCPPAPFLAEYPIVSRIDEFASLPNIPPECLALEKYGAMDFLSSPLIESIRPNILTKIPVASITEVKCGNPFISPTPYAIDPINFEFPYATNIFPDTFENPFAVNLLCSPAPCLAEYPLVSRTDEFDSFPNIPTEYLALENYGAMDFLLSPLIESIRPNIVTKIPVTSITEVKCGNPFISPTPYATDPINYEIPYATNIFPDTFENPFAINLLSSPAPFLAECPIAARTDKCASFPNIPAEYLALENYGAMDFLSSPLIESIRPNILTKTPVASITEVKCGNPFISPTAYAIDPINYEFPYATNIFPDTNPFAINLLSSPASFLAECPIAARIDKCASFPNVPAKYLALKNYGAMDFLSSPLIESIRPNILTKTPIASVTEVKCGNPFISSSPYAIDSIDYECPYTKNIFSDTFDSPFVVNLLSSPAPFLAECPFVSRTDEFASFPNIPVEYLVLEEYSAMDFLPSPLIESIRPNKEYLQPITPISPVLEITCEDSFCPLAKTLIADSSPLPLAVSCSANYPYNMPYELSRFTYPIPYALGTAAASNPFGFKIPLPLETPVFEDSYATIASSGYEAPCVNEIPNYVSPLIATPSSICAAETVAMDVFDRIANFKPSKNIKCLGGLGPSALAASKGGGLFVTSSSPSRVTGVSIFSEVSYQGPVSVAGKLPFLGTVAFSDILPSFGSGSVNYRCSSGNVAILSETAPNILKDNYS